MTNGNKDVLVVLSVVDGSDGISDSVFIVDRSEGVSDSLFVVGGNEEISNFSSVVDGNGEVSDTRSTVVGDWNLSNPLIVIDGNGGKSDSLSVVEGNKTALDALSVVEEYVSSLDIETSQNVVAYLNGVDSLDKKPLPYVVRDKVKEVAYVILKRDISMFDLLNGEHKQNVILLEEENKRNIERLKEENRQKDEQIKTWIVVILYLSCLVYNFWKGKFPTGAFFIVTIVGYLLLKDRYVFQACKEFLGKYLGGIWTDRGKSTPDDDKVVPDKIGS